MVWKFFSLRRKVGVGGRLTLEQRQAARFHPPELTALEKRDIERTVHLKQLKFDAEQAARTEEARIAAILTQYETPREARLRENKEHAADVLRRWDTHEREKFFEATHENALKKREMDAAQLLQAICRKNIVQNKVGRSSPIHNSAISLLRVHNSAHPQQLTSPSLAITLKMIEHHSKLALRDVRRLQHAVDRGEADPDDEEDLEEAVRDISHWAARALGLAVAKDSGHTGDLVTDFE